MTTLKDIAISDIPIEVKACSLVENSKNRKVFSFTFNIGGNRVDVCLTRLETEKILNEHMPLIQIHVFNHEEDHHRDFVCFDVGYSHEQAQCKVNEF